MQLDLFNTEEELRVMRFINVMQYFEECKKEWEETYNPELVIR